MFLFVLEPLCGEKHNEPRRKARGIIKKLTWFTEYLPCQEDCFQKNSRLRFGKCVH